MPSYCYDWECESLLPEKYYSVVRIIKTGNLRKRYNFCSIPCMLRFFSRKDTLEESINFLLNHPDLKIGKVDPRLKER